MRTAFEREGDIRSVDLLAAFATLWRERASGVLRFYAPGESIRFDILEGEVARVSASDSGLDAIEVLVRAGKLDATTLEGRLPSGKNRVRAARELDLLTERDWRWGERIRTVEILANLVGWLEGSYTFDPSARPEVGEISIGIQRLLLELFLRSRDRAFVHHALPAVDAPLQRAADFDEKFGTLGLTTDALAVVAAIDGRSTAAEISRRTPPDPFSVEKLLAALATLGLLHPEYAAEPAPAPQSAKGEGPLGSPLAVDSTAATRESAPPEPLPAPPPQKTPAVDLSELEVELPLPAPVNPSEPEPALIAWENAPAEPMDQPLEMPESTLPPASRPGSTAVWVLLGLALAVGALLFLRSRETGNGPSATAPLAPPQATLPASATLAPPTAPVASPVAATPVASSPPTPSVTPVPSAPVRPTALPTRPVPTRPVPTRPAALLPPSPAPVALPPGRTREEWLALAERDQRVLQQEPRARYTIQLELVCELPSLEEAWRYDRRGAMWLASAEHRGRPCFRVFWGRYASLDEARRAKESVPRFFFTPTNRPAVVSTRAALLP